MSQKLKNILCFFTILLGSYVMGQQSGWEHVKQNNFTEAKKSFLTAIKKDSTDKAALEGLIFLSEVGDNFHDAQKYATTYIKNHPEENTFVTLKMLYEGKQSFIEEQKFPEFAKISAYYNAAKKLRSERKIKESDALFDEHISDFKWSLIGAFRNVSGYGHIHEYELEKEAFSKDKTYFNLDNKQVHWTAPLVTDYNNGVYFEDHLPGVVSSETYFANTFITLDKSKVAEFRICRAWPMKMWIDDVLVFDSPVGINDLWDNEIVKINLSEGTHRVLVKISKLPSIDDQYSLFNFHDGSGSSSATFSLRLTGEDGKLLHGITSDYNKNYTSQKGKNTIKPIEIKEQITREYWKAQINKNPENWFNYYALCKYFIRASLFEEGEEYCVNLLKQHPNDVYFQYLTAKAFAYNGKIERAYEVLKDVDHLKTPIYDILANKFDELDKKNDEEEWLAKLLQMQSVNQGHWNVIKELIDYYDSKGEKDKRDEFIEKMIKDFPHLTSKLEYKKERFSNKPRKSSTDKEDKKEIKELLKSYQKEYSSYASRQLIRHYKGKDNENKVLELYDENITQEPYSVRNRRDKASYLFQLERYDEAIAILKECLLIEPYSSSVMEEIAELYEEKEDLDNALKYYEMSFYKVRGSRFLTENIERLKGETINLKSIFKTKSFDDILAEKDNWKDQYPDKDAVILSYTSDFVTDSNYTAELYQSVMILIKTEDGANSWTEYNFRFMGNITSAKVIKSNGTEVRPDGRGGYLVFKNLQPGDIIQVQGKSIQYETYQETGRDLYRYHYLTFDDPVYYSKSEIALPKNTPFQYITNKIQDSIQTYTEGSYDFYKWEISNLPEVMSEEAIIDRPDLYAYAMYSTLEDWSPIVDWYKQMTYRRLEINYEIKAILDTLIKPSMTEEEKVVAIYQYITKEIKYSSVRFLQSGFIPKRPGLTCSAKIGDCKDVAALMVGMLQELGIDAYLVLVKTAHKNSANMVPCIFFDHAIVGYQINGKKNYMDLTTDYFPHYVLPEMDLDQYGLIIKDGITEMVKLPKDNLDPKKNLTSVVVNAKLNTNRSLDLEIDATYKGVLAGSMREHFARYTAEEERNIVIDNLGSGLFNNMKLKDYMFKKEQTISEPLLGNYSATVYTYSNFVLDFVIFRVPFANIIQFNPAMSAPKRVNGIDLAKVTEVAPIKQEVNIEFPAGYKLVKQPENVVINSKFGTYTVTYQKIQKGLKVNRYIQFFEQRITAEEYPILREFYLKVLDADAKNIPIKKG